MNMIYCKERRKLTAIIIIMILVFTSLGLSAVNVNAAAKAPKKIVLTANAKTVDINGKIKVSVKSVLPANASKAVTWKTGNKKIAVISKSGIVTGKKSGQVKISAISNQNQKVQKSITIVVKNLKPVISVSPGKLAMNPGQSKILKAKVGPVGIYNKGIQWKSSNSVTAAVSSNGTVKAKAKGTAIITAYSKENSNYKASCKITVSTLVTNLKFEKDNVEAIVGDTLRNKIKIEPSSAQNKALDYSSSNKNVATVATDGTVTAQKEGTAVITAAAKDGSKKTASYGLTVLKDTSIYSEEGNANQYRVRPALLNYKAGEKEPYITTVGQWRKANNKSKDQTYFENGEALNDADIIISNGKVGLVLAVGTRNPWGYPAGSVLDAGYFKGTVPARDTVWSLEFLMNGWDSWAPENCGQVNFDLVNYDFAACKESEKGLPAVKVSRDYTVLKDVEGKASDMDVVTYYSMEEGADYAYMYDTVINNGSADVTGKTTRFALTNKGDDGGALKYLKSQRAVMSYGNKDGQEYGITYTVPKVQADSKVNVDGKGGSLGYKELRGPCAYKGNSQTTYQEYITISDQADTANLTKFLNNKNNETTMKVEGSVKSPSGDTVSNAVIIAKDSDKNTFGFYKANEKGDFSIELPQATYELYVEKNGYAKGEPVAISGTKNLSLTTGKEKVDLTINMKDQDGHPTWGRAEILGEYPEVRYTGDSIFQAKEKGVIKAKVSDMDQFKAKVYGEGYFFYSDTIDINYSDVKDQTVNVTVNKKISKPTGWLSSDLHHHANKNDGFADPKDAIPSQLAAGLDVSFISDHDFTVNNQEAYALLTETYKGQMDGFIPSEEISCSWAHFNVLPQTMKSYDFFKDENKENHVMNQFGKFPEFVKQTHEAEAKITANHPWYSYGLFYTEAYGANGVPGGFEDSYDNIEINACSSDFENANTIISATKLWTAYLGGTDFLGKKVEKPHYLLGGSDTHDVLVPGVTNKGGDYTASDYTGVARGESEHYNSGKVRTFAFVGNQKDTVEKTGVNFSKAVSGGNSYLSFGPVLDLDQKPGDQNAVIKDSKFTLNLEVKSLAKITDVLVLTKDGQDEYKKGTLNGAPNPGYSSPYQDQTYIKYDASLSPKEIADNGRYTIEIPVDKDTETWAAILVMDENGNYAVTNPYWISEK